MKSILALGTALLGLCASTVSGAAVKAEPVGFTAAPNTLKRAVLEERQGCTNGPTSRNCWSNGFDINTDMYTRWPNTGRIVDYELIITNTTCNPDGRGARVCMLINGRLPGPTLVANWGDTLRITVRNRLQHNGTSIHWHGFRQLRSVTEDGVNGITECALAPGDSKVYQFQATEYGTTWYHSHFSHQYGDGVIGTVIINGPATANYDTDLGTYPIMDWYYMTAFQAGWVAFNNSQFGLGPPVGDNILINGTNKNANGGGSYSRVTLQPGKKHRLRIVNTAVDNTMRISLDGHPFQVIATDFVPVKPYTTNHIILGIGQRYDVIITANQTAGNYWFRAAAEGLCQSANRREGRAIFTYQGQTVADPTSPALPNPPTACADPVTTPQIARNVPQDTFANQAKTLPVAFEPVVSNGQNLILWTINGTSMIIDPGKPTLQYIAEQNNSYPESYNVVEVAPTAQWTYWVIQQATGAPPIAHPIHLHGHDMFVLGSGNGQFSVANNLGQLRFTNPPRRDVTQLPGGGWLVIAYPTDNPGAWLMHCHIAFHVAMGLSTQFIERKSEIPLPPRNSQWWNTCTNWNNYQRNRPVYPQDDSGLKKRYPPLLAETPQWT